MSKCHADTLETKYTHLYCQTINNTIHLLHICDVRIGKFIAVVYDTKWCVAIIKQKCSMTADIMLVL